MRTSHAPGLSLFLVALAVACGGTEMTTLSAREHGEALFSDPSASPALDNGDSCATCHVADGAPPNDRILPGAPLAGATKRPSFWGGAEGDLLGAVNLCRTRFMLAPDAWRADDPDAQALWAYLAALPETRVDAVPMTFVRSVADVPPGDAALGGVLYERACAGCHGAPHSGEGRSSARAGTLPEAPSLVTLAAGERRLAFVEKVRQGGFLGKTGTMPPFAVEALGDAELANILAFLGL